LGQDVIEASLSKHQMGDCCSFEGVGGPGGWTAIEVFEYLLNLAGVAPDEISISPHLTEVNMGDSYYMQHRNWGESAKWKFSPNDSLVRAIDRLVGSLGVAARTHPGERVKVVWGVRPIWGPGPVGTVPNLADWKIVLEEAYEHQPGFYNWVLSDDTPVTESFAHEITSHWSVGDFCNLVQVMAGRGPQAVSKTYWDFGSWSNEASDYFISDVWQRYEAFPEGADVEAVALAMWEELHHWRRTIRWSLHDWPQLIPNMTVLAQVTAADAGIPMNSFYRIIHKSWEVDMNTGRFYQTLEAAQVE